MPALPETVFRVGVTGTRRLPAEGTPEAARLAAAVDAVLITIRDTVRATAGRAARLRVVSPLAEGADRLVARAATDLGYALDCPLPFEQGEYEKDFLERTDPAKPDTRAEFRDLLARAETRAMTLDGAAADPEDPGFQRASAYRAVGRAVICHCDILIALWDGKPPAGPGGTAEIVQWAASFGPKIWWIDLATLAAPRAAPRQVLISNTIQLRWATRRHAQHPEAGLPPEDIKAAEALAAHITAILRPPACPAEAHCGIIEGLMPLRLRGHADPLKDFLATTEPQRSRWAKVFGQVFMPIFGGPQATRPTPPVAAHLAKFGDALCRAATAFDTLMRQSPEPAQKKKKDHGPAQEYWTAAKHRIDRLATAAADRYRSSYVGVFFFAALSVAFGAISELPHGNDAFSWLEFTSLLIVLWLVAINHRHRWQERWIGCRVLAEYCRIQHGLAPIGWGLVGPQVAPVSPPRDDPPRDAWIGWYFYALLRAAPMHVGPVDLALKQGVLAQAIALTEEQIDYHARRGASHDRASRRLGSLGEIFFVLTVVLVAAKVAINLLGHDVDAHGGTHGAPVLAAACTILPALSAALVGIRSYAEFNLLAWQSRLMRQEMEAAAARIKLIEPERPLSSQDLGGELTTIANAMLKDTVGWAQLFSGKAVEAG